MGTLGSGEQLISRRTFIAGGTCIVAAAAAGGLLVAKNVSEALATSSDASSGSAQAASNSSGRTDQDSNVSLWFSPHQDDESIVLSAGILADVADGRDVHVVLCTDGSASFTRQELSDGTYCSQCNSTHSYPLTSEQFTAARDDEFRRSCLALGVPDENIHINGSGEGTTRVKDTHLDEAAATGILNHYLDRFPNAKVGLISPITGPSQHCDHYRLGRAATRLHASGKIGRLDMFVEPYDYDEYLENGSPKLTVVSCDGVAEGGYQAFLDSYGQYKSFDPSQGHYAIGYHSAASLFENVVANNSLYCYRSMTNRLTRYAGDSRYDTMRDAVLATWDSCECAIVVSGETFPDALSASALAGCYDAPILLTSPSALSSQTRECLSALGVSEVIIVGGTSAVASAAEAQISDLGISVSRVFGSSRQETACEVAARVSSAREGSANRCIVVSGDSYADALSIAPYAYASATPLYLACAGDVSDATAAAIKRGGFSEMLIVGGEKSVSSKVASKCGIYDARRLSGENRYETCARAVRYSLEQGLSITGFSIATGRNFPDALVAASCAAKRSSVVLLVQEPYRECSCVLDLLAEKADEIDLAHESCYAFGNTAALSEDLVDTVVCAATPMTDD